jgi:O-antigen ligase
MSKGAVFILALFGVTAVWGILQPAIAFFGYTVFVTTAPRWTWRFSLPEIEFQNFLVGSLIMGVLLGAKRIIPFNAVSRKTLWFLLAYLLAVVVGYSTSDNPEQSYRYLDPTWKIVLVVILGLASLDSNRSVLWILWTCVIGQGWIAYENNMTYLTYGYIRVGSFYWAGLDSNTFSIMTLPFMAMAIALALYSKNTAARLIALGVFVLQMHQLMIMQSRGTFMGGLLLALIALWFMPKSKGNIAVAILAIGAGVILAGPSVIEEFNSSFKEQTELDASADSRFKLWSAGTAIIADHPIFGVGPWMGQFYVPRYYEGDLNSGVKALHNLFFEVGTGMGLLGLVPFLAFYWFPWLAHLRMRRTYQNSDRHVAIKASSFACLCGIPAYWLASMFSSAALIESSYLLVMLGCCAMNIASKEQMDMDKEAEIQDQENWDNFLDKEQDQWIEEPDKPQEVYN